MRIAIDTGGTFTDCVYFKDGQLQVLKVFSTPANPAQAVLDGLARIGAGKALDVRHGTTVGTNTMLERKGARVAFVTTEGFEDTIAIGRQTRSKLYDFTARQEQCRVCLCVPENKVLLLHDRSKDGRALRLRDTGRPTTESSTAR